MLRCNRLAQQLCVLCTIAATGIGCAQGSPPPAVGTSAAGQPCEALTETEYRELKEKALTDDDALYTLVASGKIGIGLKDAAARELVAHGKLRSSLLGDLSDGADYPIMWTGVAVKELVGRFDFMAEAGANEKDRIAFVTQLLVAAERLARDPHLGGPVSEVECQDIRELRVEGLRMIYRWWSGETQILALQYVRDGA